MNGISSRSGDRLRRAGLRLLGSAACVLLVASGGDAQIRTGGKGGGLPGGGPDQKTDPTSTGGGRGSPDAARMFHVLDRITYGATGEDIDLVRQIGVENFIRLQLEPALLVETPRLAAKLGILPPVTTAVGDPNWNWNELYADYVLRGRYSNRQLQQVMTEFWSNHFDTGLRERGSGKVGWYASMAFDPRTGDPVIAYYDLYSQRPYYAYRDGRGWGEMRIERTALSGWFISLAFDPTNDRPSVAYYSERYQRLQYHTLIGPDWSVARIIDETGDVGWYSSLAFDVTGTAYIAYYDRTDQQLKLARGLGDRWTIEVVDASADVGQFSSLAMTSTGNPAIAYYDATSRRLKYAAWDGAVWQIEVVDAGPGVGRFASLAFAPGDVPGIAYRDDINASLAFAGERGGSWALETVDASAEVGEYASLSRNAAGEPSIAYYENAPNYDLRLARRSGLASWNVEVVEDSAAIRGEHASLGFHPTTDEPFIAFYDGSRFELRIDQYDGAAWAGEVAADRGRTDFFFVAWELLETEGLRQNAFGKFRDLLDVSAKSAAMMLFLNNNENIAGNGNENYARELLELHTVGVDGGYTQADVEKAALALTGWMIADDGRCEVVMDYFCYNHQAHDGMWPDFPGDRTIMGKTFDDDSGPDPANWMKQGNELLDFLATHPQTAKFICGKLLQKFVDDVPPARLWGECQNVFLSSGGDIERVMETILLSDEFLNDQQYRLSKIRDPYEYIMAAARHLEADTDLHALWEEAEDIGMALFRMDVPTGWPEIGTEWVSTYAMLQRWRSIEDLIHGDMHVAAFEPYQLYTTTVDPYGMVRGSGVGERGGREGAEAVVEFFVVRLLHGLIGTAERNDLVNCLSDNDPASFDIDDANTPDLLKDMVGVMLGYPAYQQN